MKRKLLFLSASLITLMLPAQQLRTNLKTKSNFRTEEVQKLKKSENEKCKVLTQKLNNSIAAFRLNRICAATEEATTSVYLLDEAITKDLEKRTYTYSPEGKRDEEKHYNWIDNEWQLIEELTRKYDYQYDDRKRCTSRTIFERGEPVSKVEISYEGTNRFYKYYEQKSDDRGNHYLGLSYENGYDAQGRDILFKSYTYLGDMVLTEYRECKYDDKGELCYELSWNRYTDGIKGGFKTESRTDGLKKTRKSYNWDDNKQNWVMTSQEIIEKNEAGRKLFQEYTSYNNENIENGSRETYTYDAYQRMITSLYEEIEDGKFCNDEREEYTYWGNEFYGDGEDESSLEDFEGPLLTYKFFEWKDNKWEATDYIEIKRNDNGIAISGSMVEFDESEEEENTYIPVKEVSTGNFDTKGNLILLETKVYRVDNNQLISTEKSEFTYDDHNRLTLTEDWEWENENWVLSSVEGQDYDGLNRKTMTFYRYKDDGKWNGQKNTIVYDGEVRTYTYYAINSADGTFNTIPAGSNSEGILPDGSHLSTNVSYDEEGNVKEGRKALFLEKNIPFNILINPEGYDDGILQTNDMSQLNISYTAEYIWENNDWKLMYENGFKIEGNDIIYIAVYEGEIYEKNIYSFDNSGRLVANIHYQNGNMETPTDQYTYEYNADNLLSKMINNDFVTTYSYSKHDVIISGMEKNPLAITLKITGRTVTSDNSKTVLKAYSSNGTFVTSGNGTITLPESGIYIIVTDTIRQKVAVQ